MLEILVLRFSVVHCSIFSRKSENERMVTQQQKKEQLDFRIVVDNETNQFNALTDVKESIKTINKNSAVKILLIMNVL